MLEGGAMSATPYADPSKHLRCLLWQLSGQYSFKALSSFLDNMFRMYFVDRKLCVRLYNLLNQDMGQDMNKVFRDLDLE